MQLQRLVARRRASYFMGRLVFILVCLGNINYHGKELIQCLYMLKLEKVLQACCEFLKS